MLRLLLGMYSLALLKTTTGLYWVYQSITTEIYPRSHLTFRRLSSVIPRPSIASPQALRRPSPLSTQATQSTIQALPRLSLGSTQALPMLYPDSTQALPRAYPGTTELLLRLYQGPTPAPLRPYIGASQSPPRSPLDLTRIHSDSNTTILHLTTEQYRH